MSMLFVIYIPVLEPEAYVGKDDSDVGPRESPKTVSVTQLYFRYVDQMRLARGGTEHTAPTPQPDHPAPPPILSKLKTPEKPQEKTLSDLTKAVAKRSTTSVTEETDTPTKASASSTIPPVSKESADLMLKDKTSNSSHVSSEQLTVNADDEALIPKETQKPELLQEQDEEQAASEEHLTLRKVLMKILDSEGIKNTSWKMTENLDYWKVTFVAESETCDLVLNSLVTFGFGKITGTSVSLFSSSYYSGEGQSISGQKTDKDLKKDADEKSEFAKSIKARLTVAQVLGSVKTSASITFDFLIMITAASFIAALGLAENSAVSIVASMLISPMMGPTIGITFGICIKSAELWKLSVKNECIGIAFCIGFGYTFGLITSVVNLNGAYWGSSDSWPTTEMTNRGLLRALWVGVLTATLSGLGVALSILGGNFGSLVGVAISASLLPPAVNAGVLWGHATVWAIHAPAYDYKRLAAGQTFQKLDPSCPFLLKNEYQFIYSCQAYLETLLLGCVSILLTIINIFCIFLIAIAVLKVKEVAPNVNIITAKSPNDVFWRTDVPMVRNSKKKADLPRMAAQFLEEYKSLKTVAERKTLVKKWRRIFDSLEDDPAYSETTQHMRNTMPEIFRLLTQRDFGSLADTSLNHYNEPPVPPESPGMFDTIQGITSNVGNRLWGWMPFTGTTETKPESAEPVRGIRRPRRSSIWKLSSYTIREGVYDSNTTNDDRSVGSSVQRHP